MATGPQRFGSSGQGPQPFGLFGGGTPFAPVPPLVSRYFNFFDGVQEYVQLAQPVTLSGSFEISVLLYPTADRAHILADNRSGNTDRLFFEEASNKIEIFVAGTAVTFSGFPPENQLSLLTLSRDASNNYTCVLNGVPLTITAGQGAGGSFSFNSIGGQFGGVTGVPPFAGIEANVRIADNGTLIHNWAIDDNSNVIADSVGSNNGTLVNPSGGWGLFDKQSDGDWLGQELATVSESPVLGDDGNPEFFSVANISGGNEYRISAEVLTFSGSADCGWTSTATGGVPNGIPATPPFRSTVPNIGDIVGGDFTSTSGPDVRLFGRISAVCSFNNLTVKQLLRSA